MADYKLTYFDFNGGRGEDCRLALHIAGVDFEDDRIQGAAWGERKPTVPFNNLPVMEVAGEGVLFQSNAVLGYIGDKFDMLPSDSFQRARHLALLSATEEMRSQVAPSGSIKDPEEKKAAREALAEGYLTRWGANMDAQIEGPFVGGSDLSVADLKIFVGASFIKRGGLDHVPADLFDDYPKLSGLLAAVAAHPKVVEWYDAH
jgi:glutathione S-transferase